MMHFCVPLICKLCQAIACLEICRGDRGINKCKRLHKKCYFHVVMFLAFILRRWCEVSRPGEIFVTFASSARQILSFIYRDGPDIAHSKGTFLQMSGVICWKSPGNFATLEMEKQCKNVTVRKGWLWCYKVRHCSPLQADRRQVDDGCERCQHLDVLLDLSTQNLLSTPAKLSTVKLRTLQTAPPRNCWVSWSLVSSSGRYISSSSSSATDSEARNIPVLMLCRLATNRWCSTL